MSRSSYGGIEKKSAHNDSYIYERWYIKFTVRVKQIEMFDCTLTPSKYVDEKSTNYSFETRTFCFSKA